MTIPLLTKDDLIAGTQAAVEVEVPGGQVRIRPLSSAEYQQVKARKLRGFSTTANAGARDNSITIDLEKTVINDFEADVMAVSMALVEPRMAPDEVKRINRAGVLEMIAKRVYDISGISEEAIKELESFRSNQ
jgi:hypothetical protein